MVINPHSSMDLDWTPEETQFWAKLAKKKIESKKKGYDGEVCQLCLTFVFWAQINCTMNDKPVFICYSCRKNPLNVSIYEIIEKEDF